MTPDDLEKHKAIFAWLINLNTVSIALLGLGIFLGDEEWIKHNAIKTAAGLLLASVLLGVIAHGRYIKHFDHVGKYEPMWDQISLWLCAGCFAFGILILAGFAFFT